MAVKIVVNLNFGPPPAESAVDTEAHGLKENLLLAGALTMLGAGTASANPFGAGAPSQGSPVQTFLTSPQSQYGGMTGAQAVQRYELEKKGVDFVNTLLGVRGVDGGGSDLDGAFATGDVDPDLADVLSESR